MLHEDLNNIWVLNEEIEKALEDCNFTQLASLSGRLLSIVETLTSNPTLRKNIQKEELDALEKLLIRVNQYQVDTENKFKDYTLKTSRQTKMQKAYKHSRS